MTEFICQVDDTLSKILFEINEEALNNYLQKMGVRITVNSLNGVMGPYVKRILCQELGMSESEAYNCTPL